MVDALFAYYCYRCYCGLSQFDLSGFLLGNSERYRIASEIKKLPVSLAEGPHPFPFRIRKLSPPALMVLTGQLVGRVDRCRLIFAPHFMLRGKFFMLEISLFLYYHDGIEKEKGVEDEEVLFIEYGQKDRWSMRWDSRIFQY